MLKTAKAVVYEGVLSSPNGHYLRSLSAEAIRVYDVGNLSSLGASDSAAVKVALLRVPAEDLPVPGDLEGSAAYLLTLLGKTPAGHVDAVFATQRPGPQLQYGTQAYDDGGGFAKMFMLVTARNLDDTFEYELMYSRAKFSLPEIRELWALSSSDVGGARTRHVIRTRPAPIPLDQARAITRAQLAAAGALLEDECKSVSRILRRECWEAPRKTLEFNQLFELQPVP